jgi:hypothetical protein
VLRNNSNKRLPTGLQESQIWIGYRVEEWKPFLAKLAESKSIYFLEPGKEIEFTWQFNEHLKAGKNRITWLIRQKNQRQPRVVVIR